MVEVPTFGHGDTEMVGPGTVTIGLMPAFPISVEPSGIVPLPVADPVTVPVVAGVVPDAVPPIGDVPPQAPDVADVPPLDVAEVACMLLTPPPSKVDVELDPETPGLVMVCVDEPTPRHAVVLVLRPSGPGLRPPGMSSVEPNGIPTGPAALFVPGTPNGDVVPIPGTAVCAKLGPQPSQAVATAITKRRFIKNLHLARATWAAAVNVALRSCYSCRARSNGSRPPKYRNGNPPRRPAQGDIGCVDLVV
jgi:hypothetical protein